MIGQRQRCRLLARDKFMTGHLIVSDEDATRVITAAAAREEERDSPRTCIAR